MNIKEVATLSRVPAKTIRFYEEIGLVKPGRASNGYRRFSERDLHKLAFIGRARSLGFTVEDCRTLLSLYEDHDRASAEVKKVAEEHLCRIAAKIAELEAIKRTLADLVKSCRGDHRPECPILEDLTGVLVAAGERLEERRPEATPLNDATAARPSRRQPRRGASSFASRMA